MASNLEPKINRIATAVTSALSALTAKGVTVPEGANVESLAPLIESIDAGGGGGGGVTVDSELSDTSENPVQNKVIKSALDALAIPKLHITVTSLDMSTMETTITADKTPNEMFNVAGPTWCVITVPESISPTGNELVLECSSFKRGYTFGYGLLFTSDLTSGIDFAVKPSSGGWELNFKYLV